MLGYREEISMKGTSRVAIQAAGCLLLLNASSLGAAPHAFEEPGVRPGEYAAFERHADFVAVADGTRLAITWYLPSKGPAAARFPVLLWYMPGHRENIDPHSGDIRP